MTSAPADEKPYITLLYRPGHYDILYPKWSLSDGTRLVSVMNSGWESAVQNCVVVLIVHAAEGGLIRGILCVLRKLSGTCFYLPLPSYLKFVVLIAASVLWYNDLTLRFDFWEYHVDIVTNRGSFSLDYLLLCIEMLHSSSLFFYWKLLTWFLRCDSFSWLVLPLCIGMLNGSALFLLFGALEMILDVNGTPKPSNFLIFYLVLPWGRSVVCKISCCNSCSHSASILVRSLHPV
jgi:hypothetical protein